MPMNPLPTSPMKILAGGRFQTRNPRAAAAKTSGVAHASATRRRQPIEQRTASETVTASLAAQAVDAIHEVREVDEPDDVEEQHDPHDPPAQPDRRKA
jgi:hypothetical protein